MMSRIAHRVYNITREAAVLHTYARRSLLSVALTAVMITFNHVYVLGAEAFGLGAVLLVVPVAFLWWFRNTRSPVAFIGYLLMNLWIVVGFGLVKGLWGIALPLFLGALLASLSTAFPRPTLGAYGFEASGILMFIGSLFVAYNAYKLLEAQRATAPSRGLFRFATSALLVLVAAVGAYGWVDQDRWTAPA